jgi:uncharacterized protein YfcZ (UPF0381/DUF406 family)
MIRLNLDESSIVAFIHCRLLARDMVDLNTAMAAAATERRKRVEGEEKEKKIRRSGADLGLEPFDPAKYAEKEKADTVSMWLVITFSVIVSLLMRYVLMGNTSPEKTDILYLLPLTAMILIPQVHRTILPEKYVEHYTKGSWVKAGFLHTFTFLAMSFLLVNPPIGDIVAPQLSNEWSIVTDDGVELLIDDGTKKSTITWTVDSNGKLTGQVWLLFGLADNVNSDGAEVLVTLSNNNGSRELSADNTFWDINEQRLANSTTTTNKTIPDFFPHGDKDQRFAIHLGEDLPEGKHSITVKITEQGDPWVNHRTYIWDLIVVKEIVQN